MAHFGSTQQPYQYVGRLGYYAHYQDPAFGLLQLGARYYQPGIGRFISRDPAKYGMNWYAYADDDPVMRIDPAGRSPVLAVIVGAVVVYGAVTWLNDCYWCFYYTDQMMDWARYCKHLYPCDTAQVYRCIQSLPMYQWMLEYCASCSFGSYTDPFQGPRM